MSKVQQKQISTPSVFGEPVLGTELVRFAHPEEGSNACLVPLPTEDKPDLFIEVYTMMSQGRHALASVLRMKLNTLDPEANERTYTVCCVPGYKEEEIQTWQIKESETNQSPVFVVGSSPEKFTTGPNNHRQGPTVPVKNTHSSVPAIQVIYQFQLTGDEKGVSITNISQTRPVRLAVYRPHLLF